jgi:hypothetical protein
LFANNRVLVVLPLPSRIAELASTARHIVGSMSGNAFFKKPTPALAAVTAAIVDLEAAESLVKARVPGAVTRRNVKRVALVTLLHGLKAYVQQVADSVGPKEAAAVIESAGMRVAKSRARVARQFEVRSGKLGGSVEIFGKVAARRAAYEWQASDDGGKTWQFLRVTMQAKTVVTGLALASTWWFRYRPVTPRGEGDWSDPLSIIVR